METNLQKSCLIHDVMTGFSYAGKINIKYSSLSKFCEFVSEKHYVFLSLVTFVALVLLLLNPSVVKEPCCEVSTSVI